MKASQSAANRIELESQILSAALRQSWELSDRKGVRTASKELTQIFPDLLPPLKHDTEDIIADYYQCLSLLYTDSPTLVVAQYLKVVRNFLKTANPQELKTEYFTILNSGFILRKPRLRLSHDLVGTRAFLLNENLVKEPVETPKATTIPSTKPALEAEPTSLPPSTQTEPVEAKSSETLPAESQPVTETHKPIVESYPEVYIAVSPRVEPASTAKKAKPAGPPPLPLLVELLQYSQIISEAEVQALKNQMSFAPEIPIKDLILGAGYVTEKEMNSLQLAEQLISQGKITLPQFAVAMYDERTYGTRMAESLQNRGWLETNVSRYSGDSR